MARPSLSIIIAVSDPVVLKGLLAILCAESDFNVVASCQDGAACTQAIRDLSPDLALVEMSLPGRSGFQLLAAVKGDQLSTRVVFLSASSAPSAAAIAMGAYGILSKQAAPHLLLRGLRQVAGGLRILPFLGMPHPHGDDAQGDLPDLLNILTEILTEREREIMRLVCMGLSNKEVGRQLSLAEGTIKVHMHHIYQKLAIQNRTSLAALGACNIKQAFEPKPGGR
jgi:DNA-binding NarL/FixJ family response regulator